jgi:hypothetical protein
MNFYDLNNKIEKNTVSKNLKYHIKNNIPIYDNIFRVHSKAYYDLIKEAKKLYLEKKITFCKEDELLFETNIGEFALYKGRIVPLDSPIIVKNKLKESKKLNSPFRTPGEKKKFAVYVKTSSGKIKKVRFGDPNLKIKNNNEKRAKSFRARHKCSEKKDRTTPGYWSCNISRYRKKLGLTSSRPW